MALPYTKIKIHEVFVEMLNENPLHEITVKALAERCQINRNTFYHYYSDIYELLSKIFQEELQLVIEEYNDTLSWEESFLLATRFALNNRKAVEHVYRSLRREELEGYIFDVSGSVMSRYVKKVNKGILASERDVNLIAYFYQSALTEMVLQWIDKEMKEEPETMTRRIGFLFDGNIELSLRRSKASEK